MRRTARPSLLPAAVLTLAMSACGVGAGGIDEDTGGPVASTDCDEHGVQLGLTPAGEVADRTFMAIGLVNCGEAPLVLDSMPQVGVSGGNVVAPRDANVPESMALEPGQGAVAPLSWTVATGEGEMLDVDRFHITVSPVPAGYELDLAEPVELDADHVLDLGAWQPAGPAATDPVEPTEPVSEAPAEEPCPESGFHVTVSQGSAAMGIRSAGIELVNCGEEDIEVNGYPVVKVLANGGAVDIEVREGSDTLQDPGPTPITVAPGSSVRASMLWRNKVESSDPNDDVNSDNLSIGYAEDSPLTAVTPEITIDLGTTRELEVTAWR